MIEKTIHLTTKDGTLNKQEMHVLCHNKELLGEEYNFVIHSDEDNENIIKSYYPELLDAYNNIKKGVIKADAIRFLYMDYYGGIYCDTDYWFLRKIPSSLLNQKCVIGAEEIKDDEYCLGQCVLMSEVGNSFFKNFVYDTLLGENQKIETENDILSFLGPRGLTKYYYNHFNESYGISIASPIVFYPECIAKSPIGNAKFSILDETIGIHLMFGSWRMETKKFCYPVNNVLVKKMC